MVTTFSNFQEGSSQISPKTTPSFCMKLQNVYIKPSKIWLKFWYQNLHKFEKNGGEMRLWIGTRIFNVLKGSGVSCCWLVETGFPINTFESTWRYFYSSLVDEPTGKIEYLYFLWFLSNVANSVETKVVLLNDPYLKNYYTCCFVCLFVLYCLVVVVMVFNTYIIL